MSVIDLPRPTASINPVLVTSRLGIGCVSLPVVDAALRWSAATNRSIMLIASRNQCDTRGGYCASTQELVDHVRGSPDYSEDRVAICRDHLGPYYGDADTGRDLNGALHNVLNTLHGDIQCGLDLIHVDVGRIPLPHQEWIARTLFREGDGGAHAYEWGSEDISFSDSRGLDELREELLQLRDYSSRIVYIAANTGSLVRDTQVGRFDLDRNRAVCELVHDHGYRFKEHNSDYLTPQDIMLRRRAGCDALNIAPQLGSIQSSLIHEYTHALPQYRKAFDVVNRAGMWGRWVGKPHPEDYTVWRTAAHYHYRAGPMQELVEHMPANWTDRLYSRIAGTLDMYMEALS